MRERQGREFWKPLVEKYERSGEPLKAFAARHKVNPTTLGWWRWRLRQQEPETDEPPIAFVEVVLDERGSAESSVTEGVVEVGLRNGMSIRVHTQIDAGSLAELAAALERC